LLDLWDNRFWKYKQGSDPSLVLLKRGYCGLTFVYKTYTIVYKM